MRRSAIQIVVVFFDILAVIALAVGQSEETLLDYRVLAIPQSQTEAEELLLIADAGKTLLTPMVGAGSGLVMTEVVPGISILAVILTDRAPLPLAQVGSPLSPGSFGRTSFL